MEDLESLGIFGKGPDNSDDGIFVITALRKRKIL